MVGRGERGGVEGGGAHGASLAGCCVNGTTVKQIQPQRIRLDGVWEEDL